jgi:hypothetical protein
VTVGITLVEVETEAEGEVLSVETVLGLTGVLSDAGVLDETGEEEGLTLAETATGDWQDAKNPATTSDIAFFSLWIRIPPLFKENYTTPIAKRWFS